MNTTNNRKKIGCIFFIVIFVVVSILISLVVTAFFYEPIRVLLPTKMVELFLLYDHIEYNGTDYYLYDSSKKPDGIAPDFDNEIKVIIANSKCRPYGDNTIPAYLCVNDNDCTYIYYDSCFYVNDKTLALAP